MFTHAGLRSFWPAVAFVPWLVLGATYLLYAVRQKLHVSPRPRRRQLHMIGVLALTSALGLASLAATRVATADPAVEASRTPHACEAATPREASSLADRLYEKGEYQRAGACYEAAGDLTHANLAFLKAAGPASEDTARGLKQQGDAAKALFAGVARTFKKNH